jgi:ADP-heptose:LPS heptosyltransferase
VNTGIMHLAIALNIPTVAIISGSPAEVVVPIGKSFRFVENKDIKQIDVENVINAIKEILK